METNGWPSDIALAVQNHNQKNPGSYQINGKVYEDNKFFRTSFRPAGIQFPCGVTGVPKNWLYYVLSKVMTPEPGYTPVFKMVSEPTNKIDKHAIQLKLANPFTAQILQDHLPEFVNITRCNGGDITHIMNAANFGYIPAAINQYLKKFIEYPVRISSLTTSEDLSKINILSPEFFGPKNWFIRVTIDNLPTTKKIFSGGNRFLDLE